MKVTKILTLIALTAATFAASAQSVSQKSNTSERASCSASADKKCSQDSTEKLVIVWSSDDPMVAERVAFMYGHAAKRSNWFSEVTLVIWGPSAKLIASDVALQKKIADMQADGVKIQACVACSDAYAVTEKLKALNYEVLPMGEPLTNYLKSGYKVLTF